MAGYLLAERDARRAAASLERLLELCGPTAERVARTYATSASSVA